MLTVKTATFSSLLFFLGTVKSWNHANFEKQILQTHESGGDTGHGTDYAEGRRQSKGKIVYHPTSMMPFV